MAESSKHYRYPAKVSISLKSRWEKQSEEIKLRAHLAMIRLNKIITKFYIEKEPIKQV